MKVCLPRLPSGNHSHVCGHRTSAKARRPTVCCAEKFASCVKPGVRASGSDDQRFRGPPQGFFMAALAAALLATAVRCSVHDAPLPHHASMRHSWRHHIVACRIALPPLHAV